MNDRVSVGPKRVCIFP